MFVRPGNCEARLRGDHLIFYCGLQKWDDGAGWDKQHRPGLYIIGYFVVAMAGMATEFTKKTLQTEFAQNFHVRYPSVFKKQRERLVLVKGGTGSRLLERAYKISSEAQDRAGKPLKVLSPDMRKVFGDFGGKVSIQRSPTRWVDPGCAEKAIEFVANLGLLSGDATHDARIRGGGGVSRTSALARVARPACLATEPGWRAVSLMTDGQLALQPFRAFGRCDRGRSAP